MIEQSKMDVVVKQLKTNMLVELFKMDATMLVKVWTDTLGEESKKAYEALCRLIRKAELGVTHVEDGYFLAFLKERKKIRLRYGKVNSEGEIDA